MLSEVVVSGLGAISAVGGNQEALVASVAQDRSALKPAKNAWSAELFPYFVAEIFDDRLDRSDGLRVVTLAELASREALRQARLGQGEIEGLDVVVGTGAGSRDRGDWRLGGVEPPRACIDRLDEQFAVVTSTLCRRLRTGGRQITINTACSSGANAIAHGWGLIRTGRTSRVLCVGVEELCLGLVIVFSMMGALSDGPCDPFGRSDGTSLGEGAGAVLLESRKAAERRAISPRGTLVGVAQSADAKTGARPDSTGKGLSMAMEQSLRCFGGRFEDITHLFTHGTGTAANDALELSVFERLGIDMQKLRSAKQVIGHTGAASGPLELVTLIAAMTPDQGMRRQRGKAIGQAKADARLGLKVATAMGGMNTAIAITTSNPDKLRGTGKRDKETAVVSGAVGVDRYELERRRQDRAIENQKTSLRRGSIDHEEDDPVDRGKLWRRLDDLGRATIVAAEKLLEELEIPDHGRVGLSYATIRGPARAWKEAATAIDNGRRLNPALIPNLSYCAAASAASEWCGLTGPLVVYVGHERSADWAYEHAVMCIELATADAMLVVNGDEPWSRADPANMLSSEFERIWHKVQGDCDNEQAVGASPALVWTRGISLVAQKIRDNPDPRRTNDELPSSKTDRTMTCPPR